MRELRFLIAGAAICLAHSGSLGAQIQAAAGERPPGVQIVFVPPPIEGVISLGIYDSKNRLVRTLHREADEKEFTAGLNGFVTRWDGRDDSGAAAPAGKYAARGFAVGDVEVEGVAMHGNDWVTEDDSLRIKRILSGGFLAPLPDGSKPAAKYRFLVETTQGARHLLELSAEGELVSAVPLAIEMPAAPAEAAGVELRDGRVYIKNEAGETEAPGITSATYAFRLFETPKPERPRVNAGSLWVIDKTSDGIEVKQFLASGEFRRRLRIDHDEPQPIAVSAAADANEILLIEEAPGHQRVRVLALEAVEPNQPDNPDAPPVQSTWKTVFSRSIHASETFAAAAPHLGREKPFAPEPKFRVRLVANPLLQDATTEIDVQAAADASGSFLQTADGLPLRQLTESSDLKWVVTGREGSGRLLTIFQSDGAVIEEFRVRKLANMMAFDAGTYELDAAPGGK